ncbi:MAG: hypothetical protein ACXVE4_07330, partial [Solirubrobacteraceae bacterium]
MATRGAELTLRGTLGVINLAGEVVGALAERVAGGSHNGHGAAHPPHTRTPPGPDTPRVQGARPSTERPPAPEPPPAEQPLNAEGPASAPEPPSAARRLAAETRDGEPAGPGPSPGEPAGPGPSPGEPADSGRPVPPITGEPSHVSEEPELVAEFAEPGAEEGVGAQLRIVEPWAGYGE